MSDYLTTAEVAAILRCSTEHAANLIRAKKLPGQNLGGRAGYRVHRDDLDAFVRGRVAKTTAPKPARRAAR